METSALLSGKHHKPRKPKYSQMFEATCSATSLCGGQSFTYSTLAIRFCLWEAMAAKAFFELTSRWHHSVPCTWQKMVVGLISSMTQKIFMRTAWHLQSARAEGP